MKKKNRKGRVVRERRGGEGGKGEIVLREGGKGKTEREGKKKGK
ncbi:hypothetical protein [Streptococcus pyogenes]|nr:hypothetical protein [Streptococcus pyogenes]